MDETCEHCGIELVNDEEIEYGVCDICTDSGADEGETP